MRLTDGEYWLSATSRLHTQSKLSSTVASEFRLCTHAVVVCVCVCVSGARVVFSCSCSHRTFITLTSATFHHREIVQSAFPSNPRVHSGRWGGATLLGGATRVAPPLFSCSRLCHFLPTP